MLDHWTEWKKRCALGLCSKATQDRLREFAFLRFRKLILRYAHHTNIQDTRSIMPQEKDSWHLFETHLTVKTSKQGQRYKDWLFARTLKSNDPAIDIIQGGASLIMRDVVREFLRRECSARNTVSLHQPLVHGEEIFTLEELLPGSIDPSREVIRREYATLAEGHARAVFKNMSKRERLVLLAREIGVSLAHEAVEKIAGCRKSTLHTVYHDFMKRVVATMKTEYRDDDSESVLSLTLMTISYVKGSVLDWGKSEPACAHLFRLSEPVRKYGDVFHA